MVLSQAQVQTSSLPGYLAASSSRSGMDVDEAPEHVHMRAAEHDDGDYRMELTEQNILAWGRDFTKAGMMEAGFPEDVSRRTVLISWNRAQLWMGTLSMSTSSVMNIPCLVFETKWSSFWKSCKWQGSTSKLSRRRKIRRTQNRKGGKKQKNSVPIQDSAGTSSRKLPETSLDPSIPEDQECRMVLWESD